MAIARYLVEDLEAAVRFYTEHLGFRAGRAFGPVSIVHRDDLELWLSGPGSSGRDQVEAVPGGWNRIVLEVPELEEAAAGLTPRGERVDGPAGSWRLVDDPWGNPIELFQPK
ncbi:MAG TPA: VOC family protein [Gaiellaceae bacterium]|jgi:catechol 2,3-dioxygenase-like lactoylglutathione lyase family enzyme|nr:VOC family protein [Gaiellaceae bacterium]